MSGFRAVASKVVSRYLNTGLRDDASIEITRKVTVLNLFAFVGLSITLMLGTRAGLQNEFILAFSLFIGFTLFLSSHLYLRFSTSSNSIVFGSLLLQLVLMTLCLYLVYSGGKNNTGPLWMYLVPPVVLFFSGLERGLFNIFIFILFYCGIVFFPDNQISAAIYSYEFKTRLLYSFVTLTFLAGFYEYSRQASYKNLTELTKEFERQATIDPLTQLLNRRGMLERIDYETAKSERNKDGIVFLIADVDHFKNINDNHGHDFGDAILVSLGQLFSETIRKQDSIARWGGEEFLFLLPNTSIEQAEQVAEKVRAKVENEVFVYRGLELKCTLSFGVAEVTDFTNMRLAIHNADRRLYVAKKHGRNRVVVSN